MLKIKLGFKTWPSIHVCWISCWHLFPLSKSVVLGLSMRKLHELSILLSLACRKKKTTQPPPKLHPSSFHRNSNIDLSKDSIYLLNVKYVHKMHICTFSRPNAVFLILFLICTKSAFFQQQSKLNWAAYLSQVMFVMFREAYIIPWEEEMFCGYKILPNPRWHVGSQSLDVFTALEDKALSDLC